MLTNSESRVSVAHQEAFGLRELTGLQELDRALALDMPREEAYGIITRVAHDLLDAQFVALVLKRVGRPLELASHRGVALETLHVDPVGVVRRLFGEQNGQLAVSPADVVVPFSLYSTSGVAVPIVVEQNCVGALIAAYESGRFEFDEWRSHLIRLLGSTATVAVRNMRTLQREKRKSRESQALATISKVMAGTLDQAQVLKAIGDQVLSLLPVDRCHIMLVDETGGWLSTTYGGGMDPLFSTAKPVALNKANYDLIFKRGQTVTLDRADSGSLLPPAIINRFGIKSVMMAPFKVRERILGGMFVDCCSEYHHWLAYEQRLVEALAEEAAVAIQATQLFRKEKEEAEISNALLQVATALGGHHTLNDIMQTVVEITPKVMNSDHCSAWVWDSNLEEFRPLQAWGLAERVIPAFQAFRFLAGEAPYTREMLGNRTPVIVEDVPASGIIPRYIVDTLNLKSLLAVPLLSRGEIVGALNIIYTGPVHHFQSREIAIAQGIANLAGLAMENAHLSEQAVKVEALRRLNRLKNEFLANVSHELRTPLQAIKGITDMLLEEDLKWDHDAEQDFLRTVSTETSRLEGMVEELLDLSRMEAGAFRIRMAECDVGKVISRISALLRPQMSDRSVQIVISPRLRQAWADERRVGQVLTNLLQNAHKYTPTGLPITISATSKKGFVEVKISDRGPGIPEEHLEHIFDRFYQIQADEPGNHGAGLGLPICRGIVEAHGGNIWAERCSRGGTTFAFTLPAVSARRSKTS